MPRHSNQHAGWECEGGASGHVSTESDSLHVVIRNSSTVCMYMYMYVRMYMYVYT